MSKTTAKSQMQQQPPKIPKKKGRPRKYPLVSQIPSDSISKNDEAIIQTFIKKAIAARKIGGLLDLYQQKSQIRNYIYESYDFGELSSISHRPAQEYLDKKIICCYRDMH